MAMTCKRCGGMIPDIGGHSCAGTLVRSTPMPYYIPPATKVVYSQKCDLCGSTAIDHTEQACQINRTFKQLEQVKTTAKNSPNDKLEAVENVNNEANNGGDIL